MTVMNLEAQPVDRSDQQASRSRLLWHPSFPKTHRCKYKSKNGFVGLSKSLFMNIVQRILLHIVCFTIILDCDSEDKFSLHRIEYNLQICRWNLHHLWPITQIKCSSIHQTRCPQALPEILTLLLKPPCCAACYEVENGYGLVLIVHQLSKVGTKHKQRDLCYPPFVQSLEGVTPRLSDWQIFRESARVVS